MGKLCLNESAGAGYLWDFETLKEKGFVILADQAEENGEQIGGDVTRMLTAHSPKYRAGRLNLALRRPWQPDIMPAEQLRIQYNLLGKEVGLPRAKRPELALA